MSRPPRRSRVSNMWNPPPEALKPLPLDRDWSKPDEKYGDPKTLYDMLRKSVDLWGADTVQCTYVPSEGMERVPITRGQFHDNVQALAAGMRAAIAASEEGASVCLVSKSLLEL